MIFTSKVTTLRRKKKKNLNAPTRPQHSRSRAQRHFLRLFTRRFSYVQGGRRREHKLASIYTNKQVRKYPSICRGGEPGAKSPQELSGRAGSPPGWGGGHGEPQWDLRVWGPSAAPPPQAGPIPAPRGPQGGTAPGETGADGSEQREKIIFLGEWGSWSD